MRDFEIFCASCGKPMSYRRAWREPLSHALVCGKECLKKVQFDYAGMIVVKKPEEEKKYLITDHEYSSNGASRDPCCSVCNEEWGDHKHK
jgi:hypothetical protein